MKNIITIFVAFLIITNCLNAIQPEDKSVLIYSVDSVKIDKIADNSIALKMKCTVPNPCYSFARINTFQSGDTLKIEVYAKTDPETICIQVLGEIEVNEVLSLKENTAFLHFFGRSSSITKTINIF